MAIEARVREIAARLVAIEARLEERLNASEAATAARFDKVDRRLDRLEDRLTAIDANHASLRRTIHAVLIMVLSALPGWSFAS